MIFSNDVHNILKTYDPLLESHLCPLLFTVSICRRQEVIFIVFIVIMVRILDMPSLSIYSCCAGVFWVTSYNCIYIHIYPISWNLVNLTLPQRVSDYLSSTVCVVCACLCVYVHVCVHRYIHNLRVHPSATVHFSCLSLVWDWLIRIAQLTYSSRYLPSPPHHHC